MSIYDDVSGAVLGGYETLYGLGNSAFSSAQTALATLSSITFPDAPTITFPDFPTLDVSFDLPTDLDLPEIDTDLEDIPTAPTINVPVFDTVPTVPEFEGEAPVLDLPTRPEAFSGAAPTAPALNYDIQIPDAPQINLPDEPGLTTLNLPSAPTIVVPSFNAVAPLPPVSVPAVSFAYTEDTYAAMINIQPAIEQMLAGLAGFPPEIEQALFDRARVREDITARKAVQETTEEWSARGFSLPQGELNRRIDETRQRNQDAVNTLNREITIRVHEQKVENLRFAVQQGLAYEGQMISLHNQVASRKLQAAELTARLGLEYFNAQVGLYNAQLAGFNAQVEVYRTQLLENAQKLELYRGQLESSRVVGELNEQRIRLYSERVRAQLAYIDIFKAQVEAERAKVDVERAQIDEYRAMVEGYSAQIQAKSAEFQAWGEEIKAEGQKADIYRSTVSAYSERVRAYSSNVEAVIAPVRVLVDTERLKLESYQSALGAVRERIGAKSQQVQAISSLFDGQARIQTAKLGAVGETARSTIAAYQAEVASAQAQALIAIENARVASENAGRNATLAEEAQKGVAQVAAQLAVGTLSAINLSATMGASASTGYNFGTSVGYSVDGGEGEPPVFGGI